MKKLLIPTLIALVLGYLAGTFLGPNGGLSQNPDNGEGTNPAWEAEKARLEAALEAARNKPAKIQTIYKELPATYTNKLTPRQILDKLIELKPNENESRNQTYQKVIHYMYSLVEAGPYAFADIRAFLNENVDVDYSQFDVAPTGERLTSSPRDGFTSRNRVRTDFLVPPSMRFGLLNVLAQVGGVEAEQMLADTLATSARGVEVAYLTRVLHEMNPGAYRDMALEAARELLTNPPPFESPNKLDENAKAYLYEILKMYRDTTFVETAQTLMVSESGRVDQSALTYVEQVLKEHAVPSILAAYNDPRVTSQRERSKLFNKALTYTGINQQANELFFQMVTNSAIPSGIRAYSMQSLAGSTQHRSPTDPSVIQGRVQFLDSIRSSITDERVLRALDTAKDKLEKAQN